MSTGESVAWLGGVFGFAGFWLVLGYWAGYRRASTRLARAVLAATPRPGAMPTGTTVARVADAPGTEQPYAAPTWLDPDGGS